MIKKLGILLLTTMMLAACNEDSNTTSASSEMITVSHQQGETSIPKTPKKVVVFNTATLDTMDALGIPVVGVPQTNSHLPPILAKYKSADYQNVGGLSEPNYELLSQLNPDLIIAGGRAVDSYGRLSELAPTLALDVDMSRFYESLMERTLLLGKIFNKEKEAQALVTEFTTKVESVKKQAENEGEAMVIMINGGKLSSFGPKSRFGFVFDALGFKHSPKLPKNEGRHGNVVSPELLLEINPDWLFVISRDSAIGTAAEGSAKQILDNPIIQKTNAWKKNQIIYLDSNTLYIAGGFQSYMQMMDQISRELNRK